MKIKRKRLTEIVRKVLREVDASAVAPAGASSPETAPEEGEEKAGTTGTEADKMSPEKAREMAAAVFDAVMSGKIGSAKSTLSSLNKTSPGRIALAVQALMKFGNADEAEINSIATIIRKVASSPAE